MQGEGGVCVDGIERGGLRGVGFDGLVRAAADYEDWLRVRWDHGGGGMGERVLWVLSGRLKGGTERLR